jgi:hypothetical protein
MAIAITYGYRYMVSHMATNLAILIEIIYDAGAPTCDCAKWKPRLMPMFEVDGQLVCSCQQCPDEFINRPVAIAAGASDQLIVLDLFPAGESDDNGNADDLCLRVFSAATGELLSTRKSLFTAGWPSLYQMDGLDPKIEWVGSLGRLVLADPKMKRVHLFQLARAECTACGCSREVDDNGDRVCFCDPCRAAGYQRSNGHPWSRMRNIARHKDDCQPCQPARSASPYPKPAPRQAPQQHPHPASSLQPWNGARYHHCASECAVCGCANERDGEGERACWCDSCRAGGCQHDDRCDGCGVE